MKTPPSDKLGGVDSSWSQQLGTGWNPVGILPHPTKASNWHPSVLRKYIGLKGPVAHKPEKLWSQRSALDLLNSGQVNPLTPGTLDGKAQPMLSGGIPEGR
jgi:hypothetical protein